LLLLGFIPFLYTIVRTNLIASIPSTDGLGIAGHIEWFDLLNETIQAFLIVPLFALFNGCIQDRAKFSERIFQTFLVVNAVYILFAAIIFMHCSSIVSAMTSDRIDEVTSYLRLETIGFIIGNMVSFVNVLFVVLEKPLYIYVMVILKTVFTVLGDLYLISGFGVNGVAYSNIVANNIIWGLMLIPISALAEIIKKDCKNEMTSKRIMHYNAVILATFLVWLCFIPILNLFLKNVMGIENFEAVKRILIDLIPFYFVYGYTVLFDNILIGCGKTYYCFAISAIVNLIYYPIVYILFLNDIFIPNITFVCMMFGFGMVIHLVCSIICYVIYKRHSYKRILQKTDMFCNY